MDVPFVVAQHDQIFSANPAPLALHQMEPKSITASYSNGAMFHDITTGM
jgi:hypothetical protein